MDTRLATSSAVVTTNYFRLREQCGRLIISGHKDEKSFEGNTIRQQYLGEASVAQHIKLVHYLPKQANDPLSESIHSIEQLWLRLSEIWQAYQRQRDEIISVTLGHAKPSLLHVGFGDGDWVLVHEDGPDRFCGAVGNPEATGKRWVACPEWTLFDRRNVLSEEAAKLAVTYWMETGDRDPRLEWDC